ncbi:Uncharacterized protein TCM_012354 [Theobroma cacao]|uniref:KIB1-4 beta-propeller domain-containing protein n=1 Tax=Theobroma cacao TaxID=3641 RepID=A0A061FUV5_THECC|nr:Uncharacterized protein TCM_012354 [Theobroma cacao]
MRRLIQAKDRPWLALPYHPKRSDKRCSSMSFQSVSSNKIYHRKLPGVGGSKTICGSSQAVLSSPPDCNPYDYVLMVIYGEKRELAYYEAKSRTWTKLQEAGRYYDDVIFHKGEFYAVDEYGKLVVCQPCSLPIVSEIAMPWLLRGSKVYLVGMEDSLCVVIRFLKDNPSVGYETYKFEVRLLEPNEQWTHLGSIEDWAFFLGQNESAALPVEDFKGLKDDRIYFTDDNSDACKYGVIGGHDSGVFDMGEESFQPLEYCQCPRPVWLTPENRPSA